MKFPRRAIGLAFCFLAAGVMAQPFGLSNRVSVPALNLPPSPPVLGYSNAAALGNMTFTAPVAIVSAPGDTNRLFIVEEIGRIVVITNLASPTRTVFLDISTRVTFSGEQGLLGLAFHPGYLTNRYFFVFYVTTGARRDQLSRFEISPSNPNQGLPNSEVVLISQPDDFVNHNAGDLHFGPEDGYLYVSLGDEGDANDTGANSQRIDKDFFSGIIRLDVDKKPGSLAPTPHAAIVAPVNYAVPPDNPFIGRTSFNGIPLTGNVRTEFWAVGLRNPWRFCFDDATGLLYVGDVGQGAREEVDVIVKGGNYGWNYREGYILRPGSGAPPAGFSSLPPILDYPRTPSGATNVGFSVTGGVVYRGTRIPQLTGAYVFGDYGSGNIWTLRYDGSVTTNVPFARILVDAGVAAFGIDPSNGDVLYADVTAGVIQRIVYTAVSGTPLPATLAQTGAFTNLTTLTSHDGIVPYDVNLPYWSDHAIKSHWFYFPPARAITFRPTNNWTFPTGSVWIQHFELELTNGAPESRQRLETRFLVRDTGTGIYGITYRWGGSPSNATLVPESGMDEPFVVNDGGNLRTQIWHYPGRSECLSCHTPQNVGGFALAFNSAQLNRDFDYSGIVDNQLRAMANAGYFSAAVSNLHGLRWLASPADEAVSVEQRVRSWLAANCVGCHQPFGPGGTTFDARIYTPLLGTTAASGTRLINGVLNNSGGDPNNRVIVPGSLSHSMLLTRISTRGPGQMPPLETSLVDTQAVALINRWITEELPSLQTFADWQVSQFGSTNAPTGQPSMDPDNDGATNYEEFLSGTDPNDGADAWAIHIRRAGDAVETFFPQPINRGIEIQWTTNLFNPAWQYLNVPENRPFLSATDGTGVVPDVITNGPPKYYRGRVFEP
ncbi:MAG TPA: PQQ-dependent sugar dehydrogenase [Verrucomicrobiae bacterium]|nr:PQQ-dependent sugar dehydrogenase [Verrucomicrobiae bacterium]